MYFFPSTTMLLSSSEDNSLKQWTFDLQSKELRLLRQRSGPRSPPLNLKFYDEVAIPLLRHQHVIFIPGVQFVDVRQARISLVPLNHSRSTKQAALHKEERSIRCRHKSVSGKTSGSGFLHGISPLGLSHEQSIP